MQILNTPHPITCRLSPGYRDGLSAFQMHTQTLMYMIVELVNRNQVREWSGEMSFSDNQTI